jgi:erythronate-4-phosphate dehydrogenase
LKVVCAASVWQGREAFSSLGDVDVIPDGRIDAEAVRDADALIIRSKTTVDEALLRHSALRFVATATAGFDHLDEAALARHDVAWAYAPGCNATSVKEYVVAALLELAQRNHCLLEDKTLAVIGVGQVGSRVAQAAEALGMRVLLNDPPRAIAAGGDEFLPLERVLPEADVVTLHVPLTRQGPYATDHMGDCRFFAQLKPGALFVNASRGEVVDSEALLLALDRGMAACAVLDVWEDEPYISTEVLDRVDLGTPHIAGYSLDGKAAGTIAVYDEACHFFELERTWSPLTLPAPESARLEVDARGRTDQEVLCHLVKQAYDVCRDDAALRAAPRDDEHAVAAHFTRLRVEYPVRREFSSIEVVLHNAPERLREKGRRLGFRITA